MQNFFVRYLIYNHIYVYFLDFFIFFKYTWVDSILFPSYTIIHTYVCMYVCMYVFMYVCMYVCMYVRTYVCVYVHIYLARVLGVTEEEHVLAEVRQARQVGRVGKVPDMHVECRSRLVGARVRRKQHPQAIRQCQRAVAPRVRRRLLDFQVGQHDFLARCQVELIQPQVIDDSGSLFRQQARRSRWMRPHQLRKPLLHKEPRHAHRGALEQLSAGPRAQQVERSVAGSGRIAGRRRRRGLLQGAVLFTAAHLPHAQRRRARVPAAAYRERGP
jgi:hypothetical protein